MRALGLVALACALPACAPTVETPVEAAYRRDLRDAERVAAQLRQLPRVQSAHVTLTRPADDPLRRPDAPRAAPSASAVLVLAPDVRRPDKGDAAAAPDAAAIPVALATDVRALVAAVAPEIAAERVTVVARPAAPPIELRRVGPFEVTRASRRPLLAALLALLALCAALGATLALRERGRRNAAA